MNKSVQELRKERNVIKKTQSEGFLEMENLGNGIGKKKDASISNRVQESEEKLSEV